MRIIHIVPRLSPAVDGVGDYAVTLARQLYKDFGITSTFLVADPNWIGKSRIEGFHVYQLSKRSKKVLLSALSDLNNSDSVHVLLHYVSYGYAKRGCPVWLIDGLESWKTQCRSHSLTTMFHELYAVSHRPWTSSFWLMPLQKKLAFRLVKITDKCITNRRELTSIIHQIFQDKDKEIATLPVFSNVGEPNELAPLVQRTKRLVIFGHPRNKRQIYIDFVDVLIHICQSLAIEQICDIGASTGLNLSNLKNITVHELGVAETKVISSVLQDSIAGLIHYPPANELAKSTIFASYCAHGLASFITSGDESPIDGLAAGQHYYPINSEIQVISLEIIERIAQNALSWYREHSLSQQAEVYASTIFMSQHK